MLSSPLMRGVTVKLHRYREPVLICEVTALWTVGGQHRAAKSGRGFLRTRKLRGYAVQRGRKRRGDDFTASLRQNETQLCLQVARRILDKRGIGRLVADVRACQQVHFGEVEVQPEGTDIVLRDRDEFGLDLDLTRFDIQDAEHFLRF